MKRREFITLLGGAAAWPLAARAQQPAMPVIGYLSSRSPDDTQHLLAVVRQGLQETGYAEGGNVALEYRWALGQYDRLPAMAAELVQKGVAVIITTGGDPSALAAKAATSTIPIVFVMGSDPMRYGLVASYNRPGGNATGINILTNAMEPKRLGILHDLLPEASVVAALVNPAFPAARMQSKDIEEAARAIAVRTDLFHASTDGELEAAFQSIAQQRIPALMVASDPFFDTRRVKLVALAAHHKLPTIYYFREFAVEGGLMSYGINLANAYREAGVYAGRILRGAKPAELPVLQSTRSEFVINLKTAKTLGVRISDNLLSLADEVIE